MDCSTPDISSGSSYRSPARILIPKLVQSRNQWKAKSHRRKRELKKATIQIRDLSLSRDRWKDRAILAEQQNHQLQQQLDTTQHQLEQAHVQIADLQETVQKKLYF